MSCGICNVFVGVTSALRKTHAATVHGHPNCQTCNRQIKNLRMFEKHVNEPHPVKKCALATCNAQIVGGKELEHAIECHNFPVCCCGETVDSNYVNFYRHLASHDDEPPAKCVACDEVVSRRDLLEAHSRETHGFPKCKVCGETVDSNWANFLAHVATHAKEPFNKCLACDEIVSRTDLEEHSRQNHNFPECEYCSEKFSCNYAVFLRHVATHAKEPFNKCVACDEIVSRTDLEEHSRQNHNFPECEVCSEKFVCNYAVFLRHVATHEVESKCPRCPALVCQKSLISHAKNVHSFPVCGNCDRDLESSTVPQFYNHLRHCRVDLDADSDDDRDCPLCDDSICTDKPLLVQHFMEKHGFQGFWCKKCDTGKDSGNMTTKSFLQHVSNCINGRQHDCAACGKSFSSRHRLSEHDCIPFGAAVVPFSEYARRLHGRNAVFRLSPWRLRVEWDMSGYAKGLPRLMPGPAYTPSTNFEETPEEAARRLKGHGRKYKLSDDSRVFCEHVGSGVPWLYRLMGTPWELGGSLMPDMKLALLRRFQERPARDLWLFLVNRLDKFKASIHELNDIKRLLQVVRLPSGTDEQYRDMEHIRMFSQEIQKSACGMLYEVEYACDDEYLSPRRVVKELHALQRAKRKHDSLLLNNLPAGLVLNQLLHTLRTNTANDTASSDTATNTATNTATDTASSDTTNDTASSDSRTPIGDQFATGNITITGTPVVGVNEVAHQCSFNAQLLDFESRTLRTEATCVPHIASERRDFEVCSTDPCLTFDVDAFFTAREHSSSSSSSSSSSLPAEDPLALMWFSATIPSHLYADVHYPASEVEQGDLWDTRCWEMMYLVFRDFVLFFVLRQTMPALRLFSNFINDEPTWRDLEQLLKGFARFIIRDQTSCLRQPCARATSLHDALTAEIMMLKNLHKRGSNISYMSCSEILKLDQQRPLLKKQRLHRHSQ